MNDRSGVPPDAGDSSPVPPYITLTKFSTGSTPKKEPSISVNYAPHRREVEEDESYVVTVAPRPRTSPKFNLSKSSSSASGMPPPPPVVNNKTGPRLALYRSNSSLDLLDRENYLLKRSGFQQQQQQTAHQQLRKAAEPHHHQFTPGCFTRRKDFGSHGSIDVLATRDGNPPAGPISHGVRNERSSSLGANVLHSTHLSVPSSASSSPRKGSYDVKDEGLSLAQKIKETSSPRLRLKFQKLFEKDSSSSTMAGTGSTNSITALSTTTGSKAETSLFRKFRQSSSQVSSDSSTGTNEPEKPILRHYDEKYRRRVFSHYDCQSITANISYAAKLRGILSKRRNTTTGASAASMLGSGNANRQSYNVHSSASAHNIAGALAAATGGQPASSANVVDNNGTSSSTSSQNQHNGPEPDLGDGNSNALVLSCPYFRNEIGGEEERLICLSKAVNRSYKKEMLLKATEGTSCRLNEIFHRSSQARGISILEWPMGQSHWIEGSCPYKGTSSAGSLSSLEAVDLGAEYYKNYFYKQEHENWFGLDDVLGPLAISIKREKVDKEIGTITSYPRYLYRLIVRSTELNTLRGSILEESIPGIKSTTKDRGIHSKELIEFLLPEVQLSCLKLGSTGGNTEDQLLKLDSQILTHRHKVGIMYCRSGQGTEEEMYNNESAGPAFDEFLDLIGDRVRLKGFTKYTGGLDNKDDSTGHYSVYSSQGDCEIIFHVSTLLPFTPNNRQQLMRKRHIGNDIVTIVFQEPGALPFTPKNIRSQFQHVFIIVRAHNPCTDGATYSVSVSRSKEVPLFGPPIPDGARFVKGKAFVNFLLAKVINAENASYRSEKFTTMATRTRQEYLKEMVAQHTTNVSIDPRPKFSIMAFGNKKKDLTKPKYCPDSILRGAISWSVFLEDTWLEDKLDAYVAISLDSLLVVDATTRETLFAIPVTSILGWSCSGLALRVYYHQGECITFTMKDCVEDMEEIVSRLKVVSNGTEAHEYTLVRNEIGQLGFHVQQDGLITEVEACGYAARAGLQQGSRLVEICKIVVATLSQEQMIDFLKTSDDVIILVIPPLPNGQARRGCDAKYCVSSLDGSTGSGSETDEYYENSTDGNGLGTLTLVPQTHHTSSSPYKTVPTHHYQTVSGAVLKTGNPLLQQAVPGNHRKHYEPRSFSPPRSSNSSGYGTGSSSKSFGSLGIEPPGSSLNFLHGLEQSEVLTSSSGVSSADDRWYDLSDQLNEPSSCPTITNIPLTLGNGSVSITEPGAPVTPPPIPARNTRTTPRSFYQSTIASSSPIGRHSHPASVATKTINNNNYKTSFHDNVNRQAFNAKREFFQRNSPNQGSFQMSNKLSPSRSYDYLHINKILSSAHPLQHQGNVIADDDYAIVLSEPVGSGPALHVPIRHPIVDRDNNGAVYQLAKNAMMPLGVSTPIAETTVRGKVTYLTDFPYSTTSHVTTSEKSGFKDPKELEKLKSERLAALKSAYLDKQRGSTAGSESIRSADSELNKILKYSGSMNGHGQNDIVDDVLKPRSNSVTINLNSNGLIGHSLLNAPKPFLTNSNVEVKLRPGSSNSKSSNGSHNPHRTSTLQEDLMRLINPDLNSDELGCGDEQRNPEPSNSNITTTNNSLFMTPSPDEDERLMALSSSTLSTNGFNDDEESYIRSVELPNHNHILKSPTKSNQSTNSSTNSSPTKSTGNTQWYLEEEVRNPKNESSLRSRIEPTEELIEPLRNPLGTVINLEARVSQLEAELIKEKESKNQLASKVENLQVENQRLLYESHSTQDQLCKFKEWLLQTVDCDPITIQPPGNGSTESTQQQQPKNNSNPSEKSKKSNKSHSTGSSPTHSSSSNSSSPGKGNTLS